MMVVLWTEDLTDGQLVALKAQTDIMAGDGLQVSHKVVMVLQGCMGGH